MAKGYLFTATSCSDDYEKIADQIKKDKPKAILASCGLTDWKDRLSYIKTGFEMVYKGLNLFNKVGVIGFGKYEDEEQGTT